MDDETIFDVDDTRTRNHTVGAKATGGSGGSVSISGDVGGASGASGIAAVVIAVIALIMAGGALAFVLLRPCYCAADIEAMDAKIERVERSRIEGDSRLRRDIRNVAATLPQGCADE